MQNLILAGAPRSALAARIAFLAELRVDVLCFGYSSRRGHVLMAKRGLVAEVEYQLERVAGAALGGLQGSIDSTLCWNGPRTETDAYKRRDETEGRAFLTQHGGWTAVAFWDRSGDQRGASNTAFLARGTLSFEQLIRAAKRQWPEVWVRFAFPVVQVDESGREVRA